MALFDFYLFVDFSASAKPSPKNPSADCLWVACKHQQEKATTHYFRTRHKAFNFICITLENLIRNGNKVFAGFDFPFAFSHPLIKTKSQTPWLENWELLFGLISDNESNGNNRFEIASVINSNLGGEYPGPFWGCPKAKTNNFLNSKSPKFPYELSKEIFISRLRLAEQRLPGTQEAWKLYGIGSAGSQGLVGIPYLMRLKKKWGNKIKVWPMETGFTKNPTDKAEIVLAEVWPSILKKNDSSRKNEKLIKDQAQVLELANWASQLDQKDKLEEYFNTPPSLSVQEFIQCISLQGWIFGAV